MNLPNKLTMARMFMIPLFLFFYFAITIPYNYLWAFFVFALASLTDMLDGKIARKHGLITDFGKLMDPLADKLLVTSALCCILPDYKIYGIISLVIILSREFLVTSIRLIAAGKGEVIAADIRGKIKTVAQMVWVCLKLLEYAFFGPVVSYLPESRFVFYCTFSIASAALLAGVVVLTVTSGVHYVWQNRRLFADA